MIPRWGVDFCECYLSWRRPHSSFRESMPAMSNFHLFWLLPQNEEEHDITPFVMTGHISCRVSYLCPLSSCSPWSSERCWIVTRCTTVSWPSPPPWTCPSPRDASRPTTQTPPTSDWWTRSSRIAPISSFSSSVSLLITSIQTDIFYFCLRVCFVKLEDLTPWHDGQTEYFVFFPWLIYFLILLTCWKKSSCSAL